MTITSDLNTELKQFLSKNNYSQIAVLCDENTYQHCYPLIDIPDHIVITIPSGEEYKNIETCGKVWGAITDGNFDRKSLLINIGGGVIGDLGGFCARTYKRGIDFINIPTTLLAQVDASIGGKLGVDFNGLKNHIGLFSIPELVIIDQIFLKTLSKEELRSGFAEVIKHHIIADGVAWKNLVSKSYDQLDWTEIVRHSIEIKRKIVDSDPTEKGARKLLNFGHTIGHAVETFLLNTSEKLLHGEAVALGMICESYIASQRDMISEADLHQIIKYINSIYPIHRIKDEYKKEIIKYALQDKKNEGRQILAVLPSSIGSAQWDCEISKEDILDAINYYNQM
ncbi:3-dehydroquinate synthase [Fulvivirga lutimaris]|nr:3-dehydroquinate synthase [Fulvivirga lutimaris]